MNHKPKQTWSKWFKAVDDITTLYWGLSAAKAADKHNIPWREFWELGLSPGNACQTAVDDELWSHQLGGA